MSKIEMQAKNITTGEFRLSFPAIFKPKKQLQGEDKYQIDMLFKKDSPEIKQIQAVLKEVTLSTWGKKPDNYKSPIKDGDIPNKQGKILKGYDGHVSITAKSKNAPGVVDEGRQPILDQNAIYAGCYCRANVTFKAYDYLGKVGVTCYLQHVQFLRKGESFGTRQSAEDVFDVVPGFDVDAAEQRVEERNNYATADADF